MFNLLSLMFQSMFGKLKSPVMMRLSSTSNIRSQSFWSFSGLEFGDLYTITISRKFAFPLSFSLKLQYWLKSLVLSLNKTVSSSWHCSWHCSILFNYSRVRTVTVPTSWSTPSWQSSSSCSSSAYQAQT